MRSLTLLICAYFLLNHAWDAFTFTLCLWLQHTDSALDSLASVYLPASIGVRCSDFIAFRLLSLTICQIITVYIAVNESLTTNPRDV